MAILKKEDLVREVVVILGARPDREAPCDVVYDELVAYFPDVTESEKDDRYRNSRSKWANRVQYARLLGVKERLIYKDGQGPQPRRGVWALTESGIREAREWHSTTTVGRKHIAAAWAQNIQERLKNDLAASDFEHELFEGAKHQRLSSYYERRPELRAAAIRIHGTTRKVCIF